MQISEENVNDFIILKTVIGSLAYGLATADSDIDIRAVYLPPAEANWSLQAPPEVIEGREEDINFFEIKRFLELGLKANPNILEILWSPIILFSDDLGDELLDLRHSFLSQAVQRTYIGYAMGQFRKMQISIDRGDPNYLVRRRKNVMHTLRLLISGRHLMKTGEVLLNVGDYRPLLLSIRTGETPIEDAIKLAEEQEALFKEEESRSILPLEPDRDRVNRFLIKARRSVC